jgi:hypothetical protein
MQILLLTLIAHTMTDFIFQNDRILLWKVHLKPAGFFAHGGILFGLLVLFLQGYHPLQMLGYSLLITLSHLGIDYLKAVLSRQIKNNGINFTVFLIDQALHILTILLVWQWFNISFNPGMAGFYNKLLSPKLLAVFAPEGQSALFGWDSLLLWILAYIWVCWGGAVIIRKFLNYIADQKGISGHSSPAQDHTIQKTGYYIGILERMLILTFVLCDSLTAVAFVFTAKSIARFNELNNREFAEYYLVGTLSSTALAIVCGLLMNFLDKAIL